MFLKMLVALTHLISLTVPQRRQPQTKPQSRHMSCAHHNPLHCVIPPYMLEKLASKGKSANARDKALKSLRVSRYFRTRRREAQDAFQALGFRAIAGAAATAAPDRLIRKSMMPGR